jgi:hypothetical protein
MILQTTFGHHFGWTPCRSTISRTETLRMQKCLKYCMCARKISCLDTCHAMAPFECTRSFEVNGAMGSTSFTNRTRSLSIARYYLRDSAVYKRTPVRIPWNTLKLLAHPTRAIRRQRARSRGFPAPYDFLWILMDRSGMPPRYIRPLMVGPAPPLVALGLHIPQRHHIWFYKPLLDIIWGGRHADLQFPALKPYRCNKCLKYCMRTRKMPCPGTCHAMPPFESTRSFEVNGVTGNTLRSQTGHVPSR